MTAIRKNGNMQEDNEYPPSNKALDSTVYVDALFVFKSRNSQAQRAGQSYGHRWCHMWSDDVEALHEMAKTMGMQRDWFQDKPGFPHYDLPPFRRALALSLGVIEHSLKDWLHTQRTQNINAKQDIPN